MSAQIERPKMRSRSDAKASSTAFRRMLPFVAVLGRVPRETTTTMLGEVIRSWR